MLKKIKFQAKNYKASEQKWNGKDYTAVPVAMLAEGVHTGVDGIPTYYPVEALKKFPEAWNGRPVSVPNHPTDKDGNALSANSPDVYLASVSGIVWNARFDDKLRADMWLDDERTKELSPELVEAIENSDPVEVSTGLWADVVKENGTWNGEAYEERVVNIYPDHLAVLPGQTGACSWDDGCGIRANKGGDMNKLNIRSQARKPEFNGKELTSWWDVDNSFEAFRNGYYLHTNTALPEVIPDKVSEAPAEMKAWIASKTLLGNESSDVEYGLVCYPVVNPKTNMLNQDALRYVVATKGEYFAPPLEVLNSAKNMAVSLLASEFGLNLNPPSANKGNESDEAREIPKGKEGIFNKLVSELRSLFGMSGHKENSETPGVQEGVAPQSEEKECHCQKEGKQMNKQEKVNALIKGGKFKEEEREKLNSTDESILEKLLESPAQEVKEEKKDKVPVIKKETEGEGEEKEQTTEDYIAKAPPEIQQVLSAALRRERERADQLIKGLLTNKRNVFTEQYLRTRSVEELEGLTALAQGNADFSLRPGPGKQNADAEENKVPTPPRLFSRKKEQKGKEAASH